MHSSIWVRIAKNYDMYFSNRINSLVCLNHWFHFSSKNSAGEEMTVLPVEKIPKLWPSITNGSTSTVHSATAQSKGGVQDIVTRERMGQNEQIFLTKPDNSPRRGFHFSYYCSFVYSSIRRISYSVLEFVCLNTLLLVVASMNCAAVIQMFIC